MDIFEAGATESFDSAAAQDTANAEHTAQHTEMTEQEAQLIDESWDDAPKSAPPETRDGETFKLKHLGEELEVTRDEVITLAQKGRDYDRIRQRLDEQTTLINELTAGGRVQTETAGSLPSADERRNREIQEFMATFGRIDSDEIPPEVWLDVTKGISLTNAYQAHINREGMKSLEAERKSRENRHISAGSRLSGGTSKPLDVIEADWLADD